MPKRRLDISVVDDGTTVELVVNYWEVIGSSQIGPEPILAQRVLSFPVPLAEDWRKDVIEMLSHRL